jgi:hypothetical protein
MCPEINNFGEDLELVSRQATDRHITVLGGMLSCVMVPPNGSEVRQWATAEVGWGVGRKCDG